LSRNGAGDRDGADDEHLNAEQHLTALALLIYVKRTTSIYSADRFDLKYFQMDSKLHLSDCSHRIYSEKSTAVKKH
jgi:hypothetical protein